MPSLADFNRFLLCVTTELEGRVGEFSEGERWRGKGFSEQAVTALIAEDKDIGSALPRLMSDNSGNSDGLWLGSHECHRVRLRDMHQ